MKRPHLARRQLPVIVIVLLVLTAQLIAGSYSNTLAVGQQGLTAGESDFGSVMINEVMFAPELGGYEWIELKNGGATPIRLAGWGLTDEDGSWYRIPAGLPPMPAGAFVIVVFDGQGAAADDLNFGNNVATLAQPAGADQHP